MRQLSMRQRQQQLLDTGYLDISGDSRLDYQPLKLDAITDVLLSLAADFVTTAQDKLEQADRTASGKLADSIIPTEVEIFGSVYRIGINVADYYKFVDQGVKGWQDEKGGNSPYQFKQGYSPKMVEAIRRWVVSEGLKGDGRENRKGSMRDQKRHKMADTSIDTARRISYSVKKKGLKPSHFWTDTVSEMEKKVAEQLGLALKVDIINNITNAK